MTHPDQDRRRLEPGALASLGVGICYGSTAVLRYVRFNAFPGELTAIEGPSGAGKSSLLDVLAGHTAPAAGEVFLVDGLGRERPEPAVRRAATSRVFQSGNLVATLDVTANVAMRVMMGDLRHRLVSVEALDEGIRDVLSALDLDELGHRLPHQLSGGQAQRVAIARALFEPTTVLIADEPTASLDPESAARVIDALVDGARRFGRTVVVASHDRALLDRADRRYRIRNHGLQRVGSAEGVLQ